MMQMKKSALAAGLIAGLLLAPAPSFADMEHSKPMTVIKDSVITTKIKTKLAAEYPKTATQIKVETDDGGTVWLSGTAESAEVADKAVAIANGTEGVRAVKSEIVIRKP